MDVDVPISNYSREIKGLVELCLVPESTAVSGRRLGNYELLEKIGGGGMGSVWRARQIGLQRDVAVKILHDDLAGEQAFTEAFRQEAEITATLKHPGIVPVHEAGEADGTWYYAMEWVDADNLEDVLREHGVRPVREAVRMVRDAAAAVGHAHGKGILHRDVKPSNLLIDAAGQVRVLDFGLARLIGPVASGRTAPLLGTPHYVAPEQAAGAASGPAADVYSLGAVLYRMLCGRVPFSGETPMAVIDQARSELPLPLRRLNASVPEDIEVIVLKCLEKSPKLRYPDATALAADLSCWLEGKPVAARPVGVVGHFSRWVKREPLQAVLIAVLVLGVAATWWQFSEASHLRRVAKRERELAALQLTATTMREGHRAEAIRLFSQSMDRLSVQEWGFPARWMRHELTGSREFLEIPAHSDKIWGMTLADGDAALVTSSEDSTVSVRDASTGTLRFSLKFPESPPFGLCADPGGRQVLVTAMNGTSRILDLSTKSWLPGPAGLESTWATRSGDGHWWATLKGNPHFWEPEGEILLWRNHPGEALQHAFPGKRAAFSPDGTLLAVGRAAVDLRKKTHRLPSGVVEVFRIATGEKIAEFSSKGAAGSVRSLAWSADGQCVVAAEGPRIHQWKLGSSEPAWTHLCAAGVWQVAFSNGEVLAACSDQAWRVLDAATGAELHAHRGHRDEVWCVEPLPGGKVATGAKDGHLLIWPGQGDGQRVIPADARTRGVFAADGRLITLDGGFLRVRLPNGDSQRLGSLRSRSLHGWDPARRAVLAGGMDGDLIWLEPDHGAEVHRLQRVPCAGKREFAPEAVGISADGKTLYECTSEGIFLRNPHSGVVLRKLPATPLPMITAAMSRDGRFLATSSASETRLARLYDAKTGQLHFLPHGRDEILACAFSPDGRWLATGGGEATVHVWDLAGDLRTASTILEGHLESVNGLAFTPDGQWLVSSGSGGALRFSLTHSWESGPVFSCPTGDGFLSFSPDGKSLTISASSGLELMHAP